MEDISVTRCRNVSFKTFVDVILKEGLAGPHQSSILFRGRGEGGDATNYSFLIRMQANPYSTQMVYGVPIVCLIQKKRHWLEIPVFGMTMTKILQDVFLWHTQQ